MDNSKICLIKKIFATIFILLFVLKTSIVVASDLTQAEKDYLKQKGTVVFVSQTHYPPFEFLGSDGDHNGMCIELIRWIATEFGFKAHFTDTSFKQAQEDVLSGRADILTSLFFSSKRDEIFDFTQMMFEVPASIFVPAERPDIKDVKDLSGKVIAMQAGDYAKEFLESLNIKCSIKYAKSFAEATDLVVSGKADAIIGDEQIVLYHIFSHGLLERIKKVGSPLYIGQNCMGLKDGNKILVSIMNKGVDLAKKKGILDQIYAKWLGVTYSSSGSLVNKYYPYLVVALIGIIFISILFWAWNMKLRQKVFERTEELSKSEKTLRTILDASPLGIGLSEGNYIRWCNPAMLQMLEYENEELIGQHIKIIYRDGNQLDLAGKMLEETTDFDPANYLEAQWVRKNGAFFYCRVRFAKMIIDHRSMIIAIAEDISQYKQAEEKLMENQTFLNAIIENIPNMIFVKDAEELRFVRFNKAGEDLIGHSQKDLIGKNDYDFFTKDQADFFTQKDRDVINSKSFIDIAEEQIKTQFKGERILHTKKIPICDSNGTPKYLLGISEDITERKQIENRIRSSLKEKEMLLREIHHRVKNNMQVVSSLLSLQADKIKDEKALEAFTDSQNRVQSIALVHEILYQSENFSEIDLNDYLNNLVNQIRPIYAPLNTHIEVRINTHGVVLRIDQAVSVGLIATELLTNSFKYAFVENQSLIVDIETKNNEDNRVTMIVADNGPGFSDDLDLRAVRTLGLNLVGGLITDQLEGNWELKQGPGTCWVINWPINHPALTTI
jgi:PAS domain S-box-containing protein